MSTRTDITPSRANPQSPRTQRLRAIAATTALAASAGMGLASASPASADGSALLPPGGMVAYQTYNIGPTTVCVYNRGSFRGHARIAWFNVWIAPHGTQCRTATYAAAFVRVSNEGSTWLKPWRR
jgi:hypothetical protein